MRISDWSSDVCSSDLADLLDESAWQAANPALGLFRSLDDLREQMVQAQRMPSMENSARNLLLNQRVSTDAPFVSPDVWKANGAKPVPFEGPVFAGLDLSARHDLTALVLAGTGARSEERAGGKGCVSPCRFRWSPYR